LVKHVGRVDWSASPPLKVFPPLFFILFVPPFFVQIRSFSNRAFTVSKLTLGPPPPSPPITVYMVGFARGVFRSPHALWGNRYNFAYFLQVAGFFASSVCQKGFSGVRFGASGPSPSFFCWPDKHSPRPPRSVFLD